MLLQTTDNSVDWRHEPPNLDTDKPALQWGTGGRWTMLGKSLKLFSIRFPFNPLSPYAICLQLAPCSI